MNTPNPSHEALRRINDRLANGRPSPTPSLDAADVLRDMGLDALADHLAAQHKAARIARGFAQTLSRAGIGQ